MSIAQFQKRLAQNAAVWRFALAEKGVQVVPVVTETDLEMLDIIRTHVCSSVNDRHPMLTPQPVLIMHEIIIQTTTGPTKRIQVLLPPRMDEKQMTDLAKSSDLLGGCVEYVIFLPKSTSTSHGCFFLVCFVLLTAILVVGVYDRFENK